MMEVVKMTTKALRFASLITCNGKVTSSSGWDTTNICVGMDETEALNKLGALGYAPYMVTERPGHKGFAENEPVYTKFRLCNQPITLVSGQT
jgi:hypothetical protein